MMSFFVEITLSIWQLEFPDLRFPSFVELIRVETSSISFPYVLAYAINKSWAVTARASRVVSRRCKLLM